MKCSAINGAVLHWLQVRPITASVQDVSTRSSSTDRGRLALAASACRQGARATALRHDCQKAAQRHGGARCCGRIRRAGVEVPPRNRGRKKGLRACEGQLTGFYVGSVKVVGGAAVKVCGFIPCTERPLKQQGNNLPTCKRCAILRQHSTNSFRPGVGAPLPQFPGLSDSLERFLQFPEIATCKGGGTEGNVNHIHIPKTFIQP